MQQVYIVEVQGWGEDEYEFVNCGVASTQAKAQTIVEKLLSDWEAGGGERSEVVYKIVAYDVA